MEHISKNLSSGKYTVNSNIKYINTVNSNTVSNQIDDLLNKLGITPEGVAKKISEDLGDTKSFDYYNILAKQHQPSKLFEALSYVKDADRRGKIRTNKAIYFQAILRRWGLQTKFRRD